MLTFYFYLQPLPSSPPLPAALQLPNAAPNAAATASPPAYTLMDARAVGDVWREYKEGIAGGPAVEKLKAEWQAH